MTQKADVFRFVLAFVAGFVAVLVFHQGLLALLHAINFAPRAPYQTTPTPPFGIPQFLSGAFWGGIWGLIWATITLRWQVNRSYWLTALLFGAVAPTLVAWFVVAPLKGLPIAGDWKLPAMITALLVNGAWGLGTALLFSWFGRKQVLQ
ncbi:MULTISPECIES: hypothetical protein [Nostoc]|uniref:hypothetical protein n=1 Tax=Nostoc commune TaxID=1178 RepID=UPI0018C602BB|nr:hypothetical protein [Nostoc commune]MBG1264234.1 hypothetical protein [Nostoc commune BAE]MBG1264552.1 hypothetical protein [Nostoc commune BAE]MBG1264839.1 hypothetical protein [Nostoc commune BAE]